MSRHTAVKRMIQKGSYIDDDYEEEELEDEGDAYDDSNFDKVELCLIQSLVDEFDGLFSRVNVIDALYETGGDGEAARHYLINQQISSTKHKDTSNNKTSAKKNKKQPEIHQQQQQQQHQQQKLQDLPAPTLLKQVSTEQKTSKNYHHVEFNLEKLNQAYQPVNYKQMPQETSNLINMIVVGHVDTGKSTLVGRLLHMLKAVDDKEMHKHTREAKKLGKEANTYAFLGDQTQQEKERGITMDIAYKIIQIQDKYFNLLDAPGHRDFVPHMITGATQSDYLIITIDVVQNAFENSLRDGIVKEHIYLAKALGIKFILVCLNKMDLINWDEKQYLSVQTILESMLMKLGYNKKQIQFIPISAFHGQNIISKWNCDWYKGYCLCDYLTALKPVQRQNDRPARFLITNKYQQHEGKLRGTCIFGKVESGQIEKGQQYVILPSGILCKIKDIVDTKQTCANEGQIVEISIQTTVEHEFQNIKQGNFLSQLEYPMPVTNLFVSELTTLDLETPIIFGSTFIMHINAQKVPVTLKKIHCIYQEGSKDIKKKFPRAICSQECAQVELETDSLICVETYQNIHQLGQFVLREKTKTIAIGRIEQIKINLNKLKEGKVLHEQQI